MTLEQAFALLASRPDLWVETMMGAALFAALIACAMCYLEK